jgi:serralysin
MAIIPGTPGPDLLDGTNSADTITGLGGNDILNGFDGDDTLNGGDDNDILDGGSQNDTLIGGAGNDRFMFSARSFGQDTITDFQPGDIIDIAALGVADLETLSPFITEVAGSVRIQTFAVSGIESITLTGIKLADVSPAMFAFNTSPTNLTITGSSGNDVVFGGNANDTLFGSFGDDVLTGGAGNDILDGGSQNDTLIGGAGNDRFMFSAREFGQDTITDFQPGDVIDIAALGVADLETLSPFITEVAGSVRIQTFAVSGIESITLTGIKLADVSPAMFAFNTSPTNLTITGSSGNDVVFGGNANDTLFGSFGDDVLTGGAGNDILDGGSQNDTLIGGTGNDILTGGTGTDRFLFDKRGFGSDTISDLTVGDRIDIAAFNVADINALTPFIRDVGGNATIEFAWNGTTDRITLTGIPAANVQASMFTFNASAGNLVVIGTPLVDHLFGGIGSDMIIGDAGDDILVGGLGDDTLVGGAGTDTAIFSGALQDYRIGILGDRVRVSGPDGYDDLSQIEQLQFGANAPITIDSLRGSPGTDELMPFLVQGQQQFALPIAYNGPLNLKYVYPGTDFDDVVQGTSANDFMNLAGGNDAANMGAGDDTVDGGGVNNFLTGGTGRDDFFLDGRFLVPVWSCITDWEIGESLTLWGWNPGVSVGTWSENNGLPGYTGATFFGDIDGNGLVETAVTWTGRSIADIATVAPSEVSGIGVLRFS